MSFCLHGLGIGSVENKSDIQLRWWQRQRVVRLSDSFATTVPESLNGTLLVNVRDLGSKVRWIELEETIVGEVVIMARSGQSTSGRSSRRLFFDALRRILQNISLWHCIPQFVSVREDVAWHVNSWKVGLKGWIFVGIGWECTVFYKEGLCRVCPILSGLGWVISTVWLAGSPWIFGGGLLCQPIMIKVSHIYVT